jgi:hypothetical protein
MAFGGVEGLAAPAGITPELEHWFAQIIARFSRLQVLVKYVTASTTQTQGQVPLEPLMNVVTCANNNDVVTLPAATAGLICIVVHNATALTTLQVYPAVGDAINGAVDTSTTVSSGGTSIFMAIDSTGWFDNT